MMNGLTKTAAPDELAKEDLPANSFSKKKSWAIGVGRGNGRRCKEGGLKDISS